MITTTRYRKMSNYLNNFPDEHREFVRRRFQQAYVFSEQGWGFGEEDEVELAPGPETMKRRLRESCLGMLGVTEDEDRRAVLEQIISTVEDSTDLMIEVRKEIDARWKEARDYRIAHPPKERKKADPPSEAQLRFLRSLGCTEVPKSKRDATKLIDKYKKKKGL